MQTSGKTSKGYAIVASSLSVTDLSWCLDAYKAIGAAGGPRLALRHIKRIPAPAAGGAGARVDARIDFVAGKARAEYKELREEHRVCAYVSGFCDSDIEDGADSSFLVALRNVLAAVRIETPRPLRSCGYKGYKFVAFVDATRVTQARAALKDLFKTTADGMACLIAGADEGDAGFMLKCYATEAAGGGDRHHDAGRRAARQQRHDRRDDGRHHGQRRQLPNSPKPAKSSRLARQRRWPSSRAARLRPPSPSRGDVTTRKSYYLGDFFEQ